MEIQELLPLGSVVLLEGAVQRLIITGRALIVRHDNKEFFFDYAGHLYPDGVMSSRIAYFNHDAISKVFFMGYNDEANRETVSRIRAEMRNRTDLKRCRADWTPIEE